LPFYLCAYVLHKLTLQLSGGASLPPKRSYGLSVRLFPPPPDDSSFYRLRATETVSLVLPLLTDREKYEASPVEPPSSQVCGVFF